MLGGFTNGGNIGCVDGGKLELISVKSVESGREVEIGNNPANGDVLRWKGPTEAGSYRLRAVSDNYVLDYNNAGNGRVLTITGPNTAAAIGTDAPVPHMLYLLKYAVADRIHQGGTAAPTTGYHARGEIAWNTNPTAGGTVGWVCTTAGTPGTWKTFGTIEA